MEWRCEWCGKPHDEDDPPCDNCGHGSFEKAVVQKPAASSGGSMTVWVCSECGREHPKHSPPCSRCGNAVLEREEVAFDDVEIDRVGYRDLLTTRYVLGLAAVAVLGGVLVLGLAGVVDIPGLSTGVPEVSNVPGNESSFHGADLAAVEGAYLAEWNRLREDAGYIGLDRDDHLADVARYVGQRRAKTLAADGQPLPEQEIARLIGDRCAATPGYFSEPIPVPPAVTDADAIGRRLAARIQEMGGVDTETVEGTTGVDVHAVDDETVVVTQIVC